MGEVVNFVNASIIAKERGIKVRESKSSSSEGFASMVAITAMGKAERNLVAGALFGTRDFRIVRVNDFLIEAVPKGSMLLIENDDRPGVIGNIGTSLGKRNINIRETSTLQPCNSAVTVWGAMPFPCFIWMRSYRKR
jgi:D-3-phosphoglycerate dehydrogenase